MNVWIRSVALDDPAPVTRFKDGFVRDLRFAPGGAALIVEHVRGPDERAQILAFTLPRADEWPLTAPIDDRAGLTLTARPIAVDRDQPGFALVGINDRDDRVFDAWRVPLDGSAGQVVFLNYELFDAVLVDRMLSVRAATKVNEEGELELHQVQPTDGRSSPFLRFDLLDTTVSEVLAIGRDGSEALLRDSRRRETAALVAVSLDGRGPIDGVELASDPAVDAGEVLLHPLTGAAQAVSFTLLRQEWEVIDPALENDFALLDRALEGDYRIVTRTDRDDRWLVEESRDDAPRAWWIYDRSEARLSPLFVDRESLIRELLPRTQGVEIAASDGQALTGYLTIPSEGQRPFPLVLLVAEDPWSRWTWGLDPLVTLLADRGCAVLRVNPRGSAGFGKHFAAAADGAWDTRVAPDLVAAVEWAVAQQVADPWRVAIVGRGLGGTQAMLAATESPRTFKAVALLHAPLDLAAAHDGAGYLRESWRRRYLSRAASPRDEARLTEISPIARASRVEHPVLLVFGTADPLTPLEQVTSYAQALQARGVSATLMVLGGERGSPRRTQNVLAEGSALEAFLALHLGVEAQEPEPGVADAISIGAEHLPALNSGLAPP